MKVDPRVGMATAMYVRLLDASGPRSRVLATRLVRLLDTFTVRQTTQYYREQRKLLLAWTPPRGR